MNEQTCHKAGPRSLEKMRAHYPLALICISLLLFSSPGKGQEDEGEKLSTKIVTVGEWVPSVADAEKLNASPSLYDSTISEPTPEYDLIPKQVRTSFKVNPIPPARLRIREPLDKLYNSYVKAGIGTYGSPLGAFHYNSKRSKDHAYGAHLKHYSSNGGVDGTDLEGFSTNQANIHGNIFGDERTWTGKMGYDRQVDHFYGLPEKFEEKVQKQAELQQIFQEAYFKGRTESLHEDTAQLHDRIALDYHYFGDDHGAKEHRAKLKGEVEKAYEGENLQLGALVDYNRYSFDPGTREAPERFVENTIVGLRPSITSKGKNWRLDLGLKIRAELGKGTSRFHFYPDAEGKYILLDGILIPYAGINGNIERNSFKELAGSNPYVRSGLDLRNRNKKLELYGGLRGAISSSLNFNLHVSSKQIEDRPLFVMDTLSTYENRFKVIHDTMDALRLRGELSYNQGERFKFLLRGTFYEYDMTNETHAWNLPRFKGMLRGTYDIQEKFIVRADLLYINGRTAKSLRPVEGVDPLFGAYPVEMNDYFDASLGIEYLYTKRLSAFFQFNNIMGDQYQRWYRYPVQGFQVLGGLTYRF